MRRSLDAAGSAEPSLFGALSSEAVRDKTVAHIRATADTICIALYEATMTPLCRIGVVALVAAGSLLGCHAKGKKTLFFATQLNELLTGRKSTGTKTALKRTAGKVDGLQIDFGEGEGSWAEFVLPADKADWRPFGALVVRVSNPSATPIGLSIEVRHVHG